MTRITNRLNETNFKLLAWSINSNITINKYGLDAIHIGTINLYTEGK